MLIRVFLGWVADQRLKIPRFHLRANLSRATRYFLYDTGDQVERVRNLRFRLR